ncbi:MAG: hypothetical protein IKZ99_04325 [Salinivirgaceae bacterium]|nr:hypothetical protein [Salinivirgaceae bacterium]
MDTMVKQPFNPAQIEILNTMAQLNTEEDLVELRRTISKFFADRADRELERLWNAGVINDEIVESWGKEHMRTPYHNKI